jgi:hypothetical protein
VIHAALLAGAAGKTFLSRSQVLAGYRQGDGITANNKTKIKTAPMRPTNQD